MGIKSFTKWVVARAARHDGVWAVLDRAFVRMARYADDERNAVVARRRTAALARRLFPDLTVRNGPFRGMRYPAAEANCSAILPKLLGSYERELQPAVEAACAADFRLVVDVGCAEGYYAVGFARRLPGAAVHAFDTDPEARGRCGAMAAANGVADRVVVGGRCGPAELVALVGGRRALVVCDCEGYELELLAADVAPRLAACTVVVEAHDFIGTEVGAALRERFAGTHRVEVVTSTDDEAKARHYDYPELAGCDRAVRREVLSERRPSLMDWLVLTPHREAGPEARDP